MKNWYVEFYTTDGKKAAVTVGAYTAIDAKQYVEKMPGFMMTASYPREV